MSSGFSRITLSVDTDKFRIFIIAYMILCNSLLLYIIMYRHESDCYLWVDTTIPLIIRAAAKKGDIMYLHVGRLQLGVNKGPSTITFRCLPFLYRAGADPGEWGGGGQDPPFGVRKYAAF